MSAVDKSLKDLGSIADFRNFLSGDKLCIVHFKSDWSDPCKQMTTILKEFMHEFKDVKFAEINAEDVPEIALENEITAVPTVVLYSNSKSFNRIDGLRKANLLEAIRSYLSNPKAVQSDTVPAVHVDSKPTGKESLEERLKNIINRHEVMVFMKGNPSVPRCGFSRTLISILNETKIPFEAFDILEDEEVRQGLKTYSNWQTYPQVYVKGELIGGLDIIKEMKESDELLATLKGESS